MLINKKIMSRYLKRHRFDLLMQLIKTSFKMRYQNSVLGVLWVLIKPYSTFFVLYSVRLSAAHNVIENYALYLLTGIVIFNFFSEMVTQGQMGLLDRANIILKVNFPRQIVIVSVLINSLINLLINFVFILFICVTTIGITVWGILYFLFVCFVLLLFSFGLSLFTSIITVRFRDLKNIFDLVLFLLYWVTPIFFVFGVDQLANSSYLLSNPIGVLMNQARAGLQIYGTIDIPLVLAYLFAALVFALIGWVFFNSKIKKIAEFF